MSKFPFLTLAADNVCFSREEQPIVDKLTFALRAGESLQIKGENGSGKSSLLRLIAGLLTPTEGQILFNQQSILSQRLDYYAHMSYLGHDAGIKANLTVKENCEFMSEASRDKVRAILTLLGLEKMLDVLCQQLSAGQKRRVGLARVLLQNRPIWLLDEPLTALDNKIKTLWQQQMQEHLAEGGIIVFSTHQELALENSKLQTIELSACSTVF